MSLGQASVVYAHFFAHTDRVVSALLLFLLFFSQFFHWAAFEACAGAWIGDNAGTRLAREPAWTVLDLRFVLATLTSVFLFIDLLGMAVAGRGDSCAGLLVAMVYGTVSRARDRVLLVCLEQRSPGPMTREENGLYRLRV